MNEAVCRTERLTLPRMKQIYEIHMVYDFPQAELKPWQRIEAMYGEGKYEGYGLYEGEELRTYALLVKGEGDACPLLDYYAVCRGNRDSGYGSLFLELLKKELADRRGILLESERIRSAANEEEYGIRTRRIAFYRRNHCIVTDIEARVFGVDYSILYLPIAKPVEEVSVKESLEHIYHIMFPPRVYQEQVRVWRTGETGQ